MMLDAALAYAASGWSVFPIQPRGKKPACANGFHDGTTDHGRLRAIWSDNPSANLGIGTGWASGVFVVDVDGDTGRESLDRLPTLPETLTCRTTQGHHYYFVMPPDRDVRCSQNKLGMKIDVRANGGYVVVPPSAHPNGHIYAWVDPSTPIAAAPAWLIDALMARPAKPDVPIPHTPFDGEGFTIEEVDRMLETIHPDCSYEEWVTVGMALHAGGYGLGVWDNWSRSGKKYQAGECLKKWSGFGRDRGVGIGTLVHMARLHGWKAPPRDFRSHDEDPDILRIRENWALKKRAVASPPPEPPTIEPAQAEAIREAAERPAFALGFDPLQLPGLIGDTVRWIVESAVKPQPELAMLNTIAALGAVFGRRYASPLQTYTNLYMVAVASTVAGKDHSRKQIKNLLIHAGLERFIGSDGVRSGVGVMKSLLAKPSQVMNLDEFGMLLQAAADIKGAHYMRAFGKNLLELYSSSGSSYDIGMVADAAAQDIIIHQPSLCIYGTTTLETYTPALNRAAIASGTLNRFIVLPSANERPVRRRSIANYKPPAPLVAAWASLAPKVPLWAGSTAVDPETVEWPGCEDRIFDMGDFEDEQMVNASHGTGALWGRYRENVIKLAMIQALTRDEAITHADIDFAEAIVGPSVRYMETLAIEHMSDSQHEADCQEVLRHLRAHGGELGHTPLYRLCRRLDSEQLASVTTSLLEQEKIEIDQVATGERGPKSRIVRLMV